MRQSSRAVVALLLTLALVVGPAWLAFGETTTSSSSSSTSLGSETTPPVSGTSTPPPPTSPSPTSAPPASTTPTPTSPSTSTSSPTRTTSTGSSASSTTPGSTGSTGSGATSTRSSATPTTSDPYTYSLSSRPTEAPPALSGASLEEQIARAAALREQLLSGDKDLAVEMARLQRLSGKANSALQEFAEAKRSERLAAREAREARAEAGVAQRRLDRSRDDLARWAADVYTQGGYAEHLAWMDALTAQAGEATNPMGDLSYLSDSRSLGVEMMRDQTLEKGGVAQRAAAKQEQAQRHAARADEARAKATAVITQQRAIVSRLRTTHAKAIREAGPLVASLVGMTHPDAKAARESLVAALKEAGIDTADLDEKPCSTDELDYPNGQVPPRALCPMIGGPGEYLRPNAAAAFNAMSKAYAKETGHLLCVTDGYRSYAEQVAVKASRGSWAAAPGRSNHGLGVAVDLCGGVDDFGHPAHLWMLANAPLYGWFHPDWAASNGSLPEPWHWEFAG